MMDRPAAHLMHCARASKQSRCATFDWRQLLRQGSVVDFLSVAQMHKADSVDDRSVKTGGTFPPCVFDRGECVFQSDRAVTLRRNACADIDPFQLVDG